MLRPGPLRLHGALRIAVDLHVQLVTVEVGIEDRDIEILSFAGPLPMEKGGDDRRDRVGSRRDVAKAEHRDRGRSVRISDHVCHRSVRLGDEVVTGFGRKRTCLAERGDRAHDDPRIDPGDGVVGKAHAGDRTGGEILYDDIHLGNQLLGEREALRPFHVDAEALLSPVLLDVVATGPVPQEREVPGEVPRRG